MYRYLNCALTDCLWDQTRQTRLHSPHTSCALNAQNPDAGTPVVLTFTFGKY